MPTLAGLRIRLWARRGTKPDRVYYANGGIGDELMLTAIARAARRAGRPIHLVAAYPDLWRDNPDPASIETDVERWWYAQRRGWIGTEIVHLTYQTGAAGHIAEQMAARANVTLPPGWRPVLPELPATPRERDLIVVQNSCRGARFRADTKEWAQERWQELARLLVPTHRLIQIGTPSDPPLAGAEDRRGKTDLMAAARLLGSAALFVGLESGLQHVAAAVSTPTVIIYGGRTRPDRTGYAFNTNVGRSPDCAGCGLNEGCPHQMVCMDIPAPEVLAAIHATLARHAAA